MKRIWCVRAGQHADADRILMTRSQIAVPSGGLAAPETLHCLVRGMRIGDAIVYPRQPDATVRLAEIVGPYVFDPDGGSHFAHRRAVS